MYNTKFNCRYHKEDVILETDDVSEDEANFIRNYLYKEDLLLIFGLDFDDSEEGFNDGITELYEKIKDQNEFKQLMEKASSMLFSTDLTAGLCVLYSYDYMYLMHDCVCKYLETGHVDVKSLNDVLK